MPEFGLVRELSNKFVKGSYQMILMEEVVLDLCLDGTKTCAGQGSEYKFVKIFRNANSDTFIWLLIAADILIVVLNLC